MGFENHPVGLNTLVTGANKAQGEEGVRSPAFLPILFIPHDSCVTPSMGLISINVCLGSMIVQAPRCVVGTVILYGITGGYQGLRPC